MIDICQLSADDLRFAQEVRAIAGWNQTDRDWLRLLNYEPDGCFLATIDGAAVATATTTRFGRTLGWIGMVLVHPDFRRRGVASALLEHCLAYLLEQRSVGCVKLDATPAGRVVYEKLGFRTEYGLSRWEGSVSGKAEAGSWHYDADLDLRAFGADRSEFIDRLAADSAVATSCDGGFGMIRSGENASYLGPVVANSKAAGETLIRDLLPRGKVFWDIPEDNADAIRMATELGLRRQRPLIRMWTGPEPVKSDAKLQWAITGPETG